MTPAVAEDREAVGPYRVIKAIGAGGSARIDLARIDRAYGFQRHVVIKRPLEHLRASPVVAASLAREARIGGQLRHPNLVGILDAGIHDGYDYLVLEYVHGAALRTVMQLDAPGKVRELPLAVALAIVRDVARGMHAAHELTDEHGSPLGLVHRDVSPGNILLGLDGSVKLADFGIAKETRIATLSGSIHGTVTYMAPEQCQGHAFDRRADVFSLGVILYELVTGSRLFWADNDVASLHRVLSGTVPRPRRLKPQLSAALEELLLTAVAHDAANRYPTALELASAIERHAATAGEVLGARWIERALAQVVGKRPVPWITAATAPGVTPPDDGSLVALLAAAEPDEPVAPTFGDTDDAVADELGAPSPALPVAASGPAPRRNRRVAAGIIALGLVAGSAVTTLVMTAGSERPAGPTAPKVTALPATAQPAPGTTVLAPATAAGPPTTAAGPPTTAAGPPTTAAGPPTTAAGPPTTVTGPATTAAGPPTTAAGPPTTAAGPATTASGPATTAPVMTGDAPATADGAAPTPTVDGREPPGPHDSAPVTPPTRRRPRPQPPRTAPRAASDRRATPPAGDPPRTSAPGPGSATPEVAPPPSNVEWKPTLLLPTDGSNAKAAK